MKVFMLGWEFPPHISGGLGTACHGMTRGLDEIGVSVCFVLPKAVPADAGDHVELRSPANLPAGVSLDAPPSRRIVTSQFEKVELHQVDAVLQPYGTPQSYHEAVRQILEQQETELIGAEGARAAAGTPEASTETPQPESPTPPRGTFVAGGGAHYAGDLMGQVHRYARLAVELAEHEQFDVIHAHDWMTYPAGLAGAAASHKPLVVHVHSTEFDRSGTNIH